MLQQTITPTSDERVMAAISHFFGLIVAIIIWATQKDKSGYVRFQSIQAMAFDLCISVITFILVGCMAVFIFGMLALGIGDLAILGTQGNPSADWVKALIAMMTAIPLLIPCIFILLGGMVFLARLVATIETFQGKDFHYPWLGEMVERSMGG